MQREAVDAATVALHTGLNEAMEVIGQHTEIDPKTIGRSEYFAVLFATSCLLNDMLLLLAAVGCDSHLAQ